MDRRRRDLEGGQKRVTNAKNEEKPVYINIRTPIQFWLGLFEAGDHQVLLLVRARPLKHKTSDRSLFSSELVRPGGMLGPRNAPILHLPEVCGVNGEGD